MNTTHGHQGAKLARVTSVAFHGIISFEFLDNSTLSQSIPATVLQQYLLTKYSKRTSWNGRALLFDNNDVYLYDIFAQKKIFSLQTTRGDNNYAIQLDDGGFAVTKKDSGDLYIFDSAGVLVAQQHSSRASHFVCELRNGNFLLSNDRDNNGFCFNKHTTDNTDVCPMRYYTLQLQDGRVITNYSSSVRVHNSSLSITKDIHVSYDINYFVEYRPGKLLCCCKRDGYEVISLDLDTLETKAYSLPKVYLDSNDQLQDKIDSMVAVESGVLLLCSFGIYIWNEDSHVRLIKAEFFAGYSRATKVGHNRVGFGTLSSICVLHALSGKLKEYGIPMDSSLGCFVLDRE
jgi:hypothetical protein